MQNKFVKPETYDNFVTEKVDVIQNKLLGDYNANGSYVINKKIVSELVELQKQKQDSYNNSMFLTGKTKTGNVINFQIDFKKNSASGLAAAELSVLESVPKQGGRLSNTIKTPIAKYTNQFSSDFIDKSLKNYNVILNAEEGGREVKELDEEYIAKRGVLLRALDRLTDDNYNVIYEDYFTQRLNLLKQTNNAYSKKVLAIFNDEFNKVSDYFLVDKKTKKVTNYKAMNELLDKAIEDISGLDNYSEQEKQYKSKILPVLGMFITSAERIEKSAQADVLKEFPNKTKTELEESLSDIKQAQESRQKPTVKESNPEVVKEEISKKLEGIKERAQKEPTISATKSAPTHSAPALEKTVVKPESRAVNKEAEQTVDSKKPNYNFYSPNTFPVQKPTEPQYFGPSGQGLEKKYIDSENEIANGVINNVSPEVRAKLLNKNFNKPSAKENATDSLKILAEDVTTSLQQGKTSIEKFQASTSTYGKVLGE